MKEHLALDFDGYLLVILLGVLATVVGYQFGFGNQTEQLPLIFRQIDPTYLQNDFYVQSGSGFGPRYYYVLFVAWLAGGLSVPGAIFTLSLGVNIALAWITFAATRDLLRGDRLAASIAAILVLWIASFPLGLVTDIRFDDFQPASLAIPGCLLALWAGIRGRPIVAALLAGLSCLPHPLYGAETGAVAIGTAAIVSFLNSDRASSMTRVTAALWPAAAGSVLLASIVAAFWVIPQTGSSAAQIGAQELIDILARFRAPHHYIPSTFPVAHYVSLGLFLVGVAAAMYRWHRQNPALAPATALAIPIILVLSGCLLGYLLLEVWPTRVGLVAQPFRMLYLVKWLGMLCFGWLIADWLRRDAWRPGFGWAAMLGSGAVHVVTIAMTAVADLGDRWLRDLGIHLPRLLLPTAAIAMAAGLAIIAGDYGENLRIVTGLVIAVLLVAATANWWKRSLAVVFVVAIAATLIAGRATLPVILDEFRPVLTFADHRGPRTAVALWAAENTAADAVFIVPPDMNGFRVLANRAVVVDFKSVPFDDLAMREWRRRISDSFGETDAGGFAARADLDENYRAISSPELRRIAALYTADYAVLHSTTATDFAVLYRNDAYSVVAIESD